MAIDWVSIAAGAKQALQEVGFAVTIKRVIEGIAPDPAKPWIVNASNAAVISKSSMIWDWSPYMVEQAEDSSVARNAYIAPFGGSIKRAVGRKKDFPRPEGAGEGLGGEEIVELDRYGQP